MSTLRSSLIHAAVAMTFALGLAACSSTTSGTPPVTTVHPARPIRTNPPAPLVAPHPSTVADSQYLVEVAEADPALGAYAQRYGNVALRALLTDGSAFCAFLQRGGGVDGAALSTAVGARGIESETHLPLGVATFNTLEAVALLTLCPSEQRLVPAADQTRIRALGRELDRS